MTYTRLKPKSSQHHQHHHLNYYYSLSYLSILINLEIFAISFNKYLFIYLIFYESYTTCWHPYLRCEKIRWHIFIILLYIKKTSNMLYF